MLASVQSTTLGYSWIFSYDPMLEDGDLVEVQFPQFGSLSWTYEGFQYAGARTIRQVANRQLLSNAQQQSPNTYTLTWPDTADTVPFHTAVALDDISSGAEKYWSFNTSGSSQELVSELQYRTAPGVTSPLPRDETYAWSLDANGNSFLNTATTTLDEGAAYAQTTKTVQAQDGYGNVTSTTVYDYGNQSTRTYASTYL
jgi:hypothetical protein